MVASRQYVTCQSRHEVQARSGSDIVGANGIERYLYRQRSERGAGYTQGYIRREPCGRPNGRRTILATSYIGTE